MTVQQKLSEALRKKGLASQSGFTDTIRMETFAIVKPYCKFYSSCLYTLPRKRPKTIEKLDLEG